MVKESRSSGNEALENAAVLLNQFLFGSSKFEHPKKLAIDKKPEDNSKEVELQNRERAFVRREFEKASNELGSRVDSAFKSAIEAHIDPKDSMTDYVKRTAVREASEQLEKLISKDARFKVIVDKLWERALKDNFSKESTDKIRSAFISKGKTLLPAIITKVRNEALKGMGKRVRNDDEPHQNNGSKKASESSRRDSSKANESSRRSDSGKGDIPEGMSSLEYLMQD
jgi:hypothetical protein